MSRHYLHNEFYESERSQAPQGSGTLSVSLQSLSLTLHSDTDRRRSYIPPPQNSSTQQHDFSRRTTPPFPSAPSHGQPVGLENMQQQNQQAHYVWDMYGGISTAAKPSQPNHFFGPWDPSISGVERKSQVLLSAPQMIMPEHFFPVQSPDAPWYTVHTDTADTRRHFSTDTGQTRPQGQVGQRTVPLNGSVQRTYKPRQEAVKSGDKPYMGDRPCGPCRSAKIQCDLKHPTCSSCSKRSRPCTASLWRPALTRAPAASAHAAQQGFPPFSGGTCWPCYKTKVRCDGTPETCGLCQKRKIDCYGRPPSNHGFLSSLQTGSRQTSANFGSQTTW
ncbi:hypothetical protein TREMEDRAFT_65703 [Tremella mesenterica DSM 1558]|uniref:uncharacterized protein n=1 Tax=Tremella mesenterica (strain ATCC 24925 / CBS 8224 / DSM 1558 / NBRC 9311 / NRRL Y-6157 / RJB 2259-6 / UBC 559-6) TaxID=578456 RepID=UPI00032C728D|nr:uncharacterized protein TREMEDRAFT_65703 [Tremella mesenterica DSM 1558]EIW66414.1 hypothetical protein TREMEDRAFT_65703 [Tremella mesenterica DSM 1558]